LNKFVGTLKRADNSYIILLHNTSNKNCLPLQYESHIRREHLNTTTVSLTIRDAAAEDEGIYSLVLHTSESAVSSNITYHVNTTLHGKQLT